MDWPTPKNVNNVHSFMGLASVYRRFIENFSRVSYTITSLQNKDSKLVWTSKCEGSFQRLKQLITTTPILKMTDPYGEFFLCTNACKEGASGFLL